MYFQLTSHSLTREKDGRFSDANIARVLQDATADRACAFRARGVPAAMRIVEILGMEQARAWGACSVSPIWVVKTSSDTNIET